MTNKYTKFFYQIIVGILIYIICGISYNMFNDILFSRIINIYNKTYFITVYNDNLILDRIETRSKPKINTNSITFLDINENWVTYSNFKYKVYELKDGNDIH